MQGADISANTQRPYVENDIRNAKECYFFLMTGRWYIDVYGASVRNDNVNV